jgi:hypothetical protein
MTTPDLSRAVWRKSSYSGDNGGQCVEIAANPGWAAIRDSKDPAGGALALNDHTWEYLRAAIKATGSQRP